VRDFVRARGADDLAGASEHATWVVEQCEPLAARLDHVHDAGAVARLDVRANDLLAVSTRDDLLAARATRALEPVIAGRVPASAHLDLLGRAIAISQEAESHPLRGELTRARGRVLALMGRFDEARSDLSATLAFAERAGRVGLTAACVMELGVVCHMTGDVEGGATYFRRVLDLRGELLSPRIEARAIGNLGGLLHDGGDLTEAYKHYVEAIALAESADDQRLLGVFMTNLAVLDADRGHPVRALARLRRAVGALGGEGEERLLAIALGNLGMVQIELAHLAEARTHLERAARILGVVGDERSESLSRARLCFVHAELGDLAAGRAALATARRLGGADPKTGTTVEAFALLLQVSAGEMDGERARAEMEALRLPDGRLLLAASDDARAALRVLRDRRS
jgi:tetratricopeptide (TPR) repeat protein